MCIDAFLEEQCYWVWYDLDCCRFEMVLPHQWRSPLRPICIQMGGTGDHVSCGNGLYLHIEMILTFGTILYNFKYYFKFFLK